MNGRTQAKSVRKKNKRYWLLLLSLQDLLKSFVTSASIPMGGSGTYSDTPAENHKRMLQLYSVTSATKYNTQWRGVMQKNYSKRLANSL